MFLRVRDVGIQKTLRSEIVKYMYHVLCIMYYVLCTLYYVLCTMYYESKKLVTDTGFFFIIIETIAGENKAYTK